MKKLIVLLSALFILLVMSSCGKKDNARDSAAKMETAMSNASAAATSSDPFATPEGITKHFFETLRSGDFEESMACFTPLVQNQYKAALSLSGLLPDISSDLLRSVLTAYVGQSTNQTYANYQFDITGSEYTDNSHAIVSFNVFIMLCALLFDRKSNRYQDIVIVTASSTIVTASIRKHCNFRPLI